MLAHLEKLTTAETLTVCAIGMIIVILELALIAVLVLIISKLIGALQHQGKATVQPVTEAPAVQAAAPAGIPDNSLELTDVDEKTAAVIMAIVSAESGIPLEKLYFKSIKLIEE